MNSVARVDIFGFGSCPHFVRAQGDARRAWPRAEVVVHKFPNHAAMLAAVRERAQLLAKRSPQGAGREALAWRTSPAVWVTSRLPGGGESVVFVGGAERVAQIARQRR
jgi:hypothetical protein